MSKICYDITTYEASLDSLSRLTNRSGNDIKNYIILNGQNYSVSNFLEEFTIDKDQLLEKDIWLTSLHVTTNNDNCASLKKHGLLNLQEAVLLNTPLNYYLKEHNITFDLERKIVQHNNKIYDISKEFSGFSYDKKERALDFIVFKLFEDYQLNGFFSYDNVLTYGGYVNRRPEFLYNLAELLNLPNLEYDWVKNNRCYVIKFIAPINDYTDWNFINKSELKYLDQNQIELKKREWIITETLSNIYNGFFHRTVKKSYSYIHPNKIIPYSNFIEVYTDNEYLKTYGYEKD
ncbi:hypothetical protein AM501_05245 [Aneurinibacillus migulanus]|uniref:hypothetical protein n=1 Tax=Aneurinibacillus migulanus TaxID=47500 RepID=UPI0005B9D765|nr:hypothetical protein [Aneurinibacillus migulanus]KIV58586.1 hypothetical protein TS64_04370 [Aneurinibacillus migulanus]KPD09242.1 hypothetical protein AM501_05245 [Aneurinibacillus migulanus]CEH28314.1 Uncharacterized protein BN1090_A2_00732 [Aneurinibacillus migulanus]